MNGMNLGTIWADIKLNTQGVTAGVTAVKRDLATAATAVEKNAAKIGAAGKKMSLAVTAPIIGVGVAVTKMAMDAVESENLFDVSMGNMAGDARKWSKQLRNELGLNSYEVRKNVGTFNVMFNSLGLAEDASYDMAKGLTQLSYDMASFYNLRPEEAFQKLQAGITGEIEPLKRLGIVVNETTTKEYAYAKGIAKRGAELTEAQKVQARYLLIMEQTSKAQGDLARTMDSPANKLRVLKARASEVGIEFGQVLIPFLSKAVDVGGRVVKWLEDMDPASKNTAVAILAISAAIGPLLVLVSSLSTAISALSGVSLAALATPLGWTIAAVGALALGVYGASRAIGYLTRDTVAEAKAVADSSRAKADAAKKTADLTKEADDLQKKTSKTAEESDRLREILEEIAKTNPELVRGFEKEKTQLKLVAGAAKEAAEGYKEKHRWAVKAQEAALREEQSELRKERVREARARREGALAAQGKIRLRGGQVIQDPLRGLRPEEAAQQGYYMPKNREAEGAAKALGADSRIAEIDERLKQINKDLKYVESGKLPPSSGTSSAVGTGGATTPKGGTAPMPVGLPSGEAEVAKAKGWLDTVVRMYQEKKGELDRVMEMGDLERAGRLKVALDQFVSNSFPRAYKDLAEAERNKVKLSEAAQLQEAKTQTERVEIRALAAEEVKRIETELQGELKSLDNKTWSEHRALERAKQDVTKAAAEEAAANAETASEYDRRVHDLLLQQASDKQKALEETAETIAEYDRRVLNAEEEKAAKIKQAQMELLEFQRKHRLIDTQDYIKALDSKLAAEEKYTDGWYAIHDKLEIAHAEEARAVITIAEEIVQDGGKKPAMEYLEHWLAAFEAMGTAGVDAAEVIQGAIDKLNSSTKKNTQDWKKTYRDVLGGIRSDFVSTMAGMIQGTTSFKDFMKQTWNQILRFVINALLEMALTGNNVFKQMGFSLTNFFGSVTSMISSDLAKLAAQAYGVMGILDSKKRKKSLLGGVLGGVLSIATGGAFTLGSFLTGAGIGNAIFDNPIYDTAAVRAGQGAVSTARSNADFDRLFSQGALASLAAGVSSRGGNIQPVSTTRNTTNNQPININMQVDKLSSEVDVQRALDNGAWLIHQRLGLG